MKKYQSFLSKIFQFLEVKFSIYLNRRVFVMTCNAFWIHFMTGVNAGGFLSILISRNYAFSKGKTP